jgi:hypothetical protein
MKIITTNDKRLVAPLMEAFPQDKVFYSEKSKVIEVFTIKEEVQTGNWIYPPTGGYPGTERSITAGNDTNYKK